MAAAPAIARETLAPPARPSRRALPRDLLAHAAVLKRPRCLAVPRGAVELALPRGASEPALPLDTAPRGAGEPASSTTSSSTRTDKVNDAPLVERLVHQYDQEFVVLPEVLQRILDDIFPN